MYLLDPVLAQLDHALHEVDQGLLSTLRARSATFLCNHVQMALAGYVRRLARADREPVQLLQEVERVLHEHQVRVFAVLLWVAARNIHKPLEDFAEDRLEQNGVAARLGAHECAAVCHHVPDREGSPRDRLEDSDVPDVDLGEPLRVDATVILIEDAVQFIFEEASELVERCLSQTAEQVCEHFKSHLEGSLVFICAPMENVLELCALLVQRVKRRSAEVGVLAVVASLGDERCDVDDGEQGVGVVLLAQVDQFLAEHGCKPLGKSFVEEMLPKIFVRTGEHDLGGARGDRELKAEEHGPDLREFRNLYQKIDQEGDDVILRRSALRNADCRSRDVGEDLVSLIDRDFRQSHLLEHGLLEDLIHFVSLNLP